MAARKLLSSVAFDRSRSSISRSSRLGPLSIGLDELALDELGLDELGLDELELDGLELDELVDPCSEAVSECVAEQAIVPSAIEGITTRTVLVRIAQRVLLIVIRRLLEGDSV